MINAPYATSYNPIWSFVDLMGNPFDDTFYMWVLNNEIPYQPATVYQTPTGTPWANPIRFLANGTLPYNIYWDPAAVYRLEYRQNLGLLPPSQSDPLIYLVENYVPSGNNGQASGGQMVSTANQIANPQFSDINFESPFTLTNVTDPAPIEIAPNWVLDLSASGTGNVTVSRIPLNDTNKNPTNAPYALRIALTGGWTNKPVLRQRFEQNGMLWANKHVSTSLTGLVQSGSNQITVRLDASNGQPLAVLMNVRLSNIFEEYTSTQFLGGTVNGDLPPDAYIDYKLILPTTADIYLTSFQIIASSEASLVTYQQDTIDRQLDHLFHYYNPQLQFKQIPSYLVGWDFPLNPAQFYGSTVPAQGTGDNSSYYAWDQTIVFQSENSGITISRGSNKGLKATLAKTGQFALIQYLSAPQVNKILQDAMSVNIVASGTIAAGSVIGSISLWYTKDSSLPNVATGTNQTFIASLNPANGRPATFTAGTNWIEITRNVPQNATFILSSNALKTFNFNGWNINNGVFSDVSLANFFAIVIGFSPLVTADFIETVSVSLVAGDIPSKPAPQTVNEVLSNCQYYYEKTYASEVPAGTVTNENSIVKSQNAFLDPGVAYKMVAQSFSIDYMTLKRNGNASIVLYNPSNGARNEVLGSVFGAGSGTVVFGNVPTQIWTTISNSKSTIFNLTTYYTGPSQGSISAGGWASGAILLHYVVDNRLGIN